MRNYLWAGLAALLCSLPAQARDVEVSEAWSRATAPGQENGMVQLVITSKQAAQLVGASSPACNTVELHSMVNEGGMMRMRQVEAIDLPAGAAMDMGAQGYHLMLMGLKKPLKEGAKVEVTLRLRRADGKERKVKTRARVRSMTEGKPEMGHDSMPRGATQQHGNNPRH